MCEQGYLLQGGLGTNTGEHRLPFQDKREGGEMTDKAGKARVTLSYEVQ